MATKKSPAQETRFGSYVARTWYDRSSRNWITEVVREHRLSDLGPHFEEVRQAEYTGNREDAFAAHDEASADANALFQAACLRGRNV